MHGKAEKHKNYILDSMRMAMYEYFCDYAGIVNHQSHMEMREKEKNSERVRAAKGRTH